MFFVSYTGENARLNIVDEASSAKAEGRRHE
jgi:hypothetical protein